MLPDYGAQVNAARPSDGKRLIARLDEMIAGTSSEPIHLSTRLLLNKEQKAGESKGKKYSWVAHNMQFDHIAILRTASTL